MSSTLEAFTDPGPVDPRIEVTGYVHGEHRYDHTGLWAPSLIVHTTSTLWPLVLDVWSVAAALHSAGARLTPGTDLNDLARLVLVGVQVAGWLRVGAMGIAAGDIGERLDHGTADSEDHLILIEHWGSDTRRRACWRAAWALCATAHTTTLRQLPGHGHCPTLGEITTPTGPTSPSIQDGAS